MDYETKSLIQNIVITIAICTMLYYVGLGFYRSLQTYDKNTQEIKLKCLELKGYYEQTINSCILITN